VEVECLPANLPEKIVLDVNELRLGKSLHVRELPPVEGVRILNSPEQVVCAVVHKRLEVEKPAEAAVPAEGEEAAAPAEGEEAAEAPAEE
jgi:large subunit ribosomal protein L25